MSPETYPSNDSCRVCGKSTDGLPIAYCSRRCVHRSDLDRFTKVLFFKTVFDHTKGSIRDYKRNCAILPDWIRTDTHDHQVLRSAAGHYVGSLTEDGMPYARYTPYMSQERATFLFNTRRWVHVAHRA